jgi:dCMP deaminase
MDPVAKIEQTLSGLSGPLEWDEYFFCLCLLISSRSRCNRLHVGCVIVKDRRVLATGYNGFLAGAPHQSIIQNNHEQATVHAEANAICHAAKTGSSLEGATAYVTHYPCLNCCKSLISSGIKNIRYLHNYRNDPIVERMCQDTGVTINSRDCLKMT